jgi:diacylglycerol kinase family enzyme
LIASNRRAGARSGADAVRRVTRQLLDCGFQVEEYTEFEVFKSAASDALDSGALRAVVAAGGDGTAAAVVNATRPETPIAVLPLGTENLLAKYFGFNLDPTRLCRTIERGDTIRLDAGCANRRVFLLMLGCGLDAEVVRRLHADRRDNIRHLSYAKPILGSLRSYEYPEMRVYCEGDKRPAASPADRDTGCDPPQPPITARWVFVANLPCYASGLKIVPRADGADGLLDVCTFRQGSLWNGLRYLGGVILGRHETWRDCVSLRTRRLRIESNEPVPYQVDGDPGGCLPVDIEVLPQRVTILTPEG